MANVKNSDLKSRRDGEYVSINLVQEKQNMELQKSVKKKQHHETVSVA